MVSILLNGEMYEVEPAVKVIIDNLMIENADFNYLYCPICGNRFETWVQLDPYCGKCGQRLKL